MKKTTNFINLMRTATYTMLYSTLAGMGAEDAELKAFEEYKELELQDIQTAGAWVREWQQAKVSETIKEAYLLDEQHRKQQEKIFYISAQKEGLLS